MNGLVRPTKKQRELLAFIEQFITEHGYSPSYREIMNGCQYSSVATVALHVSNLIKRGHLRKREHSARSLEVVSNLHETGHDPTIDEHEQWLVERVAAFVADIDAARTAEGRVLVQALRLLGLERQADDFDARLVGLQAPAQAEKAV